MDRNIDLTLNNDFAENVNRLNEWIIARKVNKNQLIPSDLDGENTEVVISDRELGTDFFTGSINEIKFKKMKDEFYKEIDEVEKGLRCERCGCLKVIENYEMGLCERCDDELESQLQRNNIGWQFCYSVLREYKAT